MTLKSIHAAAGVTEEKVREEAGWTLRSLRAVAVTPPPTREELEVLRNRVDNGAGQPRTTE